MFGEWDWHRLELFGLYFAKIFASDFADFFYSDLIENFENIRLKFWLKISVYASPLTLLYEEA